MGLEIERNFLLLAFIRQNRSDEEDQAVWRNAAVKLEPLLRTGDGSEYRKTIDSGFDV